MSCPICGGEMWDNRPKKASGEFNAKGPDLKCKDKACKGVIWPDKDDKPKGTGKPSSGARPVAKWTWGQLSTLYERSILLAAKHVVAASARAKIPAAMADVTAAAATIFIAASRDGVADTVAPPPQRPMTEKPEALDDDDGTVLPF